MQYNGQNTCIQPSTCMQTYTHKSEHRKVVLFQLQSKFETQFNLFLSLEDSDYFNFLLFISCIENFLNSQYFSNEKVFNTAQYTFERFLRLHFINIEVRFFGQHRKTGNFQNWFLPAHTVPFEKFRNQSTES